MMASADTLYPPVAFYFTVAFGTQSQNVDASFREVSGIGPEIETEPLNEGGENRYRKAHRVVRRTDSFD